MPTAHITVTSQPALATWQRTLPAAYDAESAAAVCALMNNQLGGVLEYRWELDVVPASNLEAKQESNE